MKFVVIFVSLVGYFETNEEEVVKCVLTTFVLERDFGGKGGTLGLRT